MYFLSLIIRTKTVLSCNFEKIVLWFIQKYDVFSAGFRPEKRETIMALYVNTNVSSINAQRKLTNATNSLNVSYQRLASGFRINSAKDDAAAPFIKSLADVVQRRTEAGPDAHACDYYSSFHVSIFL